MKPRFSQEKRSHHECCRLILKVAIEHNESKINGLNQYVTEILNHVMPLPTYLHGHFACKNYDSL